MIKNSFVGALLLLCSSVFAQNAVHDQFAKITTVQQAQQWMDANPKLKPALLNLNSLKDSTVIDKRLLRQNQGDVFSVGYVTYKIVESAEKVNYRANYIFLDGGSLSESQVDSIKKIIVQKASSGGDWNQLSDQYTMDGNTAHGDTGWVFCEEMMPKEFQDAVKNHKTGEIFFVDVSDRGWHYIVKKTYDDDDKKTATVLRA